ncbi:uncharacterized protein LOC113874417 [Abrus precatorius]|uniref:Uncharacterized protein LOC113874417 n=1 Tax=Abrus precatorius TaxID=3816 RepID=A0A8B8MMI0_ABRPR|nr:uncharacterized protein LOC113874417 [Abrus precatorius]
MKLLTSSSSSYSTSPSSSSSSSTLSFDPPLCNSKSASAGYLTAILRRILCSGGLPTHPSDQIRELDSMSKMNGKVQEFKAKQNTEATTTTATTTVTPGLVARLMGLNSMGERHTPFEANSSSSLSRSKSMNFVDYLGECKQMDGQHKHVKSSSFREVSTFHLLENENFLVLSFENGAGESKEFKSKGRRKEKGSSELKQKREERGELKNKREKVRHDEKMKLSDMSYLNVGNDGKHKLQIANNSSLFKVSSEKEYIESEAAKFSHPMKRKEVTNGEKVKRRKKGTTCYAEKKVETECSSEDSSPVSVFDFEREAPRTEEDSFGVGMSWRRKLSPELENDQLFILHCDKNLIIEDKKVKAIENNKHEGSKEKEKQSRECIDIWGEICRLVEDELRSSQLEGGVRKQSDFENINADFESEIFDHLLNELIEQLVENPLKALQLENL